MNKKALKIILPLLAILVTSLPVTNTGYVASIPSQAGSFDEQWGLSAIAAPQAWEITSGGSAVLVAILDTGIDQTHEDLVDKVIANVNFTDSPTADDIYGHGTHIAGIIATAADDAGITGLAYNSSLMNVKVARDDGSVDPAAVAKGIMWAVDNGANVINISLTITKPSPTLEDALNYAWDKGAVIIAAAGNNFSSTPVYPAAYPNVIAVAATDKDGRLPRWSNRGDWVSLAAPGVDIYSTLPGDDYGYQSGTSQAAALVSGEAALLFTIATDTNGDGNVNDEIRHTIETGCDEVEQDELTRGRINALKAVNHK